MESKDLRFFLEVAKTNSISKAADNLYTSQSNVSAHIKKIENELNIELLSRNNKGVILTKEGKKLLVYAENIVSLVDEANNLFLTNEKTFVIGTTQTLALTLPKNINTLQQKFPNTLISIKILNDIDFSKENILDCVISNSSKKFLNYKVLEILEQLVVIAPQDCQNIEALTSYLAIVNNISTCPYRNLLLKYLIAKKGQTPNIIEMDSIEGIINLVELGSGISLIPKRLVKENMKINKFCIKELGELVISVWLKDKNTEYSNMLINLYKNENVDFIK